MKLRAFAAGTTALALGLTGALVVATPAAADEFTILTPGWEWYEVSDNGFGIDDVSAFQRDFMGSGLDVWGWTFDGFDDFLTDANIIWDGDLWELNFTPVSDTIVDDGLSTIVASGVADVDGTPITVTSTLTIQGNFSRWTFDFDGDSTVIAASRLAVTGELGSDEDSTFVPVGSRGMVSHDLDGYDPIIGWDSNGTNLDFDVLGGDDDVTVAFDAVDATALTIALLDYDPCMRSAAIAQMTAAVPTLASQFGATWASLLSTNCATVTPPALTPGPISVDLPITSSAALEDWGYFSPTGLGDLTVFATGLPAGVTASAAYVGVVPTLSLSGTLPSGSSNVTAWIFSTYSDGATFHYYPLQITFTIGPALAATGSEIPTPLIVGASLLTLLGVVVVLSVGRRRMLTR